MEVVLVTSVLSSIGLGISSFFGFFLLKNKKLENRLLAWLLIALSLRIIKSIFYVHLELPLAFKNMGLAANLAVGPLLYLYTRIFFKSEKLEKTEAIHFIPSALYLILSPILPNGGNNHFWILSYSAILIQSFTYVFMSVSVLLAEVKKGKRKSISWIITLITVLTLMWLVYTLIFLKLIPVYSLGPVTFSVSIFILLYVALGNNKLFAGASKVKYLNFKMTEERALSYFSELKNLMYSEELYKKTDLSLSSLAKKMNLLNRDLSLIINKYGNSNFSQFVNEYRISEAKNLITKDSSKKLIVIAYEAGFNNLSTFNQVFKSMEGITPSEFRKKTI